MKWKEIRKLYPSRWLLIEALKARTVENKRILDELAVLNTFPDGQAAWHAYAQLHEAEPTRELFVLHTDRKEIDITVKRWVGLRGVGLLGCNYSGGYLDLERPDRFCHNLARLTRERNLSGLYSYVGL